MKKFIKNSSLSLAFILLFLISIAGQIKFGREEHNRELLEQGGASLSLAKYLTSGHFIESTFENWESEFLQMALFIVLTIFLQQKGSSESKDFEKDEPVDCEPDPKRKGAPWPVRKGGWILAIYKYSLTIAFVILFLISFALHFYGSLEDENQQLFLKSLPTKTPAEYLTDARFWFESFQNWQSEFLSVFAIIILTVFLRQKGSPQSKPVDAPNHETGE
ncbi:MAG: DUF6766 family protein [Bacteroidales bacterium]